MEKVHHDMCQWNRRMTRTGNDVSFEWDSFEQFLPDLENVKKHDRELYERSRSYAGSGTSWLGVTDGFDGIISRVQHGWPELRQQLDIMLKNVELEVPRFPSMTKVRRRKRTRDDHGDVVNMQRVWSGDLDHAWDRPERVDRTSPNTKRITLAFDVTANGSVTNEMAMWRAALCMLLVNSLSKAGRTFEIWVTDSTSMPFQRDWTAGAGAQPTALWTAWCVKTASDPIVMDRLCAMVSVGFMRTVGFTAESCGPWPVSPGFGGALNRGLPHSLRERQGRGEVVLRIGECYSKQDCLRHYREAWTEIETALNGAAAA